jgi:transcriptional regulator with XRE-family HTH domain
MKFNNQQFTEDVRTKRIFQLKTTMDIVAEMTNVSKATISRIEKGAEPDINTFASLLEFLGTNPERYFVKNIFVLEDEVLFIKTILPNHYQVKATSKSIHCSSNIGIIEDLDWYYFLNTISTRYKKSLQEVFHNVNTNHCNFQIYVSTK